MSAACTNLRRLGLTVCLAVSFALLGALPALGDDPTIRVRYRSADTIYLDAGSRVGLSVGDRLEISREGERVALIEVVFVAGSSSSARAVEERGEILAGDLAKPLAALSPPADAPSAPPSANPPTPDPPPTVARRSGTEGAQAPYRRTRKRRTRLSGTASVDFETFSDDGDDGRDVDLTTARLTLRGRDLGGLPLDLRVRLRSRSIDRSGPRLRSSLSQDRLYELSLRWAPDSNRYAVELGRLGAGPYTGIGYLDGVSARYAVVESVEIGGFAGSRPDFDGIGFESSGTKYGVFARFQPRDSSAAGTAAARGAAARGIGPWEVFLAGLSEETDTDDSREVVVLETRLGTGGGRWSLAQRAELDLGDSGRSTGAGDDGSQLTQLALALTGRLSERSRVTLSYDRYDPVLLFEDDLDVPGRAFRDLLRQGLRASVSFGRADSLLVRVSGGLRQGEGMTIGGDDDQTYSFGFGASRHRTRGLSLSADVLGFSNPYTDGLLATLRSRWGFEGGHSLGVVIGSTAYEPLAGDEAVSGWARLEGWVELPASLYARGDVEILAGDDAEGQRLRVGLGYRF